MNVRSANSGNAGVILFRLACSYSKTSASLANDTSMPNKDREELAEQYAVSAIKLLNCARNAGYFYKADEQAQLRANADLEALRRRPEFLQFVKSIGGTL